MLNAAFDSLGEFFSKVFLGGYFFPALLAVLLNVAIYLTGVTGVEKGLGLIVSNLKLTNLAGAMGLLALVAVTLAFLIAPFSGGLRNLLAGEVAPGPWRKARLEAHRAKVANRQAEIDQARTTHGDFADAANRIEIELRKFRSAAGMRPTFEDPRLLVPANEALEAFEAQLWACRRFDRPESSDTLPPLRDHVVAAMTEILRTYDTVIDPENPKPSDAHAAKFDAALLAFDAGLRSMGSLAVSQLVAAERRLFGDYDPDNLQPTRFGNLSAVMQAYGRRVYGLDYHYIVPRLDLAIAGDDGVFSALDRARIQVESALTFFALLTLSLVIWLVVLGWRQEHAKTFATIGFALPITVAFLHEFVVQAQRGFAERFQAVLDARRFDVLAALHLDLPTDIEAERGLWQRAQAVSAGQRSVKLVFKRTEGTAP